MDTTHACQPRSTRSALKASGQPDGPESPSRTHGMMTKGMQNKTDNKTELSEVRPESRDAARGAKEPGTLPRTPDVLSLLSEALQGRARW